MVSGMQPESVFEDAQRIEKIKYIPWNKIKKPTLDIGGGNGSVWVGHDLIVDNIEPDPVLAEEARESGVYRTVYNQFYDPIIDLLSYDLITILGVMEHIENDVEFLSQFADATRIYLTVPNAWSYHRLVGVKLGQIGHPEELHEGDHRIGHQRVYNPTTFKALILDAFGTESFNMFVKTVGFKWTNSDEMEPFMDRYHDFCNIADEVGISGDGKHGAEIVAYLEKS